MRQAIRPGEDVTEAICQAVAEETGRRPRELRPLGERFDTDAIESRFTRSFFESPESMTIVYEGRRVTIGGDAVAVEQVPPV